MNHAIANTKDTMNRTTIPGAEFLADLPAEILAAAGIPENAQILGLFEGYGGLTLGTKAALGGELVAYAEIEPASCKLLEGHFPGVPNVGDVSAIDWHSWAGRVNGIAGGFPCQDVSVAGVGKGVRPGTRSGLWYEFARGIAAIMPEFVIIENVSGLRSAKAGASAEEVPDEDVEVDPFDGADKPLLRALGAVLGDLSALGYDAEWISIQAAEVGAPHRRERVFILATRRMAPVVGLRELGVWNPSRQTWDSASGAIDLFSEFGEPFADSWPKCGAMRGDVAFARPNLSAADIATVFDLTCPRDEELMPTPHVTAGKGAGEHGEGSANLQTVAQTLLPTPVAKDADGARNSTANRTRPNTGHQGDTLTDAVSLLPTPAASDATGGRISAEHGGTRESGAKRSITLASALHHDLLPTPSEALASGGQTSRSGARKDEPLLPGIVRDLLPTPLTTDAKQEGPADANRDTVQLRAASVLFPTPTTQESHSGPSQQERNTPPLNAVVELLPTPVASEGTKATTRQGVEQKGQTGQVWLTNVAHDLAPHLLPTPAAHDSGNTPEEHLRKKPGRKVVTSLQILADHDLIAKGGDPTAEPAPAPPAGTNWGKYEAAIRLAEYVTGRESPPPTNPDGKGGAHRLAAEFVEFMMLLPAGWVTGTRLAKTDSGHRNAALARLGNGVVPLQAAVGISILVTRAVGSTR